MTKYMQREHFTFGRRDSFKALVHLLWRLEVTEHIHMAMVSNSFHLIKPTPEENRMYRSFKVTSR